MPTRAFQHRALTGWISEYINRPLPGVWPQIPLDDQTLADFDAYFALCQECGYNEVVLWGGFVDRRWPLDIASCIDAERSARLRRLLDAAHARDLKIQCGLGLYSWGFEAIIEAYPHLHRTNPRAMCPAIPEAQAWMEKVVVFVLDNFAFDGLNMQSADQGRCECEACRDLTTVAYHARLNREVARFVRDHWPDKMLIVDNWGCPFSDPAELPHLAALSREVDYILDFDNSAQRLAPEYRQKLIANLACPFGTLAGRSVWPPQRWPRDKWFVPTTLVNVAYVRKLYADGGRAIEQFVTTLANPSGEITLRFMGGLMSDVDADPYSLLQNAVERTYASADQTTLDALTEIVVEAERAFFDNAPPHAPVGLIYLDGGLEYAAEPNPARYLRDMTPERRAAYAQIMTQLAARFERLRPALTEQAKADLTARCFATAIADALEAGA